MKTSLTVLTPSRPWWEPQLSCFTASPTRAAGAAVQPASSESAMSSVNVRLGDVMLLTGCAAGVFPEEDGAGARPARQGAPLSAPTNIKSNQFIQVW